MQIIPYHIGYIAYHILNFNERQRVSIIEKVYFYIFICETFWKGSYQVDLESQSIFVKIRLE